jgi:ABC-type phosphate transport system substrate-binding protein
MSYSIDFSSQDFFLAMTKNLFDENLFSFAKNSFKKWNEISTFLPEREIKIYGPGSNSPFFFFLKNSILSPICLKQKFYSFRFKEIDFEESLKFCSELRIDSIYIEDDSGSRLSSERIMSDKTSFFIVPFHIYQRMNSRNKNFLEVHNFDGINPTEENIKNSRYRFSWPIYIFVEKDLLKSSQLAKSFIDEIKSENSSGPRGVLREYGLIPN